MITIPKYPIDFRFLPYFPSLNLVLDTTLRKKRQDVQPHQTPQPERVQGPNLPCLLAPWRRSDTSAKKCLPNLRKRIVTEEPTRKNIEKRRKLCKYSRLGELREGIGLGGKEVGRGKKNENAAGNRECNG